MIIVEVARKALEKERELLMSMMEASEGSVVRPYLLGALAVIDWLNEGERCPSSQILEQQKMKE